MNYERQLYHSGIHLSLSANSNAPCITDQVSSHISQNNILHPNNLSNEHSYMGQLNESCDVQNDKNNDKSLSKFYLLNSDKYIKTNFLSTSRSSQCQNIFSTCFICGKNIETGNTQTFNSQNALMSMSRRVLSELIFGILNVKSVNDTVCVTCFSLFDQVDHLESELDEAKVQIQYSYNTKLTMHHYSCEAEHSTLNSDVNCGGLNESIEQPNTLIIETSSEKKHDKKNSRHKSKSSKKMCLRNKEDRDVGDGETTKECPSCKKAVIVKGYLLHLSQHRLFPCPFCEEICKRKDIKSHIAEFHQEEIHFPCIECSFIFDSFTRLRQHCSVAHMGLECEKVFCNLCSKSFSSVNGLKVHKETLHIKNQCFECPDCKESFTQKGNMLNHYKRIHAGKEARKISCDFCNKGFICPSDLRKHVERVHLKVRKNEVFCQVCKKPFSDSRALKIHINAVHTKNIQYPCPECSMVFHSLTNMVSHRRRMHGGTSSRKNLCNTCGKGFCSPSDLQTHIKVVHENIRKFSCDICGQSFKVGSHLKYHRRRHTGEMPYECPHCSKRFHGPSHIADHVKKVHKTVYVGVNQQKRLNTHKTVTVDSHTSHENVPKKSDNNMLPPTTVTFADATSQLYSRLNYSSTVPSQISNSIYNINSEYAVHSGSSFDQSATSINPYSSMQYNHNNQSPVPMVVRLLHDMQY